MLSMNVYIAHVHTEHVSEPQTIVQHGNNTFLIIVFVAAAVMLVSAHIVKSNKRNVSAGNRSIK